MWNVRLRNEHNETGENKKAWPIKRKLREAFVSAWDSLRPVSGIPLYIRAETAIPIGVALIYKGMSVGGAGMAIPEMTRLASIFGKKLVAVIIALIFFTAGITGYLFNVL